jgi:hypothetical protein
MLYRAFCYVVILAVSIAFFPTPNVNAGDSSVVDAKADKVLRQMSEYLNSLEQFTFHAENTQDELLSTGQKVQRGRTVNLSVRRPDRFLADVKGDARNQQLFYDGKTITLYGKNVNFYATIDAPATIDTALDHALESFGLSAPLADFISKGSYEYMKENVDSGFYVGLSNVHGVESHHLAFRQEDIDWQIWIENSKTPLPRKIVITNKWQTGAPQFTALLSDWNLSPMLKDSLFTFVPPDKAEKIEFLPVD